MKPIRFSADSLHRMLIRGATQEEVIESINGGNWLLAGFDRLESRTDFTYNELWNGRRYMTKRVRPIIVEEESEIVIVTVYTYFF